jgi:non-ribosomal peptide synthetase component F
MKEHAPSAMLEWHLPKSLGDHLKAVGQEQAATLYMVMVAAFKALCYRYTGQEEILVESSFPNREGAELAPLVAPFVNMVTLRTDLSGNPEFRELLGRVRETVIGALTHRDFPFVKVLEELQPEYYTSHNRLGRVFVAQYAADGQDPPLPGLTYGRRFWFRRAMPDIYMSVVDYEEYIEVAWEYSTHLFEKKTIVRMFNDYTALLEEIVSDPGKRLSDLTIDSEVKL